MTNEAKPVKDPLGKIIFLLHGICEDGDETPETVSFDFAVAVISKPALVYESQEGDARFLYYFRSVDWHNTMLIVVQFHNDRWESLKCIKNPSVEELTGIMKKGNQLL